MGSIQKYQEPYLIKRKALKRTENHHHKGITTQRISPKRNSKISIAETPMAFPKKHKSLYL